MCQIVLSWLKQFSYGCKNWIAGTSAKVRNVLQSKKGVVVMLIIIFIVIAYDTNIIMHRPVTHTDTVSDTQNLDLNQSIPIKEGRVLSKLLFVGKQPVISENCKKEFPDAIIIGVMKGGTEAFSTFLAIHPQVAMQFEMRSTLFFTAMFNKGFDWYREQMPCRDPGQVTVDKSPQYWASRDAPSRIHKFKPDIKLILLVRNPVDRSVSHFLQQNNSNPQKLHGKTFEKNVLTKAGSLDTTSGFIELSTYSVILQNWLQLFKLDQILIIDGDTFRANPAKELGKAEKFLNITSFITAEHFEVDSSRNVSCIKLPDNEPSCLSQGKGRTHPDIDPDVEQKLKQYYKPYNEQFYKTTGINFDW